MAVAMASNSVAVTSVAVATMAVASVAAAAAVTTGVIGASRVVATLAGGAAGERRAMARAEPLRPHSGKPEGEALVATYLPGAVVERVLRWWRASA